MSDTSEKYPVCLNRNTRAALRRFLQPLSFFALLKARRAPSPAGVPGAGQEHSDRRARSPRVVAAATTQPIRRQAAKLFHELAAHRPVDRVADEVG
jgi:hypothetical protein